MNLCHPNVTCNHPLCMRDLMQMVNFIMLLDLFRSHWNRHKKNTMQSKAEVVKRIIASSKLSRRPLTQTSAVLHRMTVRLVIVLHVVHECNRSIGSAAVTAVDGQRGRTPHIEDSMSANLNKAY